ncbi:MAG: class I SAM-dependent methyltransferase [Desulfobacterales bacterium]|nr:class I SAM-dependent methyltransferase [Desulfobacterales bacterium]
MKKSQNSIEKWESVFKKNQHTSRWPWSDLISYVVKYGGITEEGGKVLELGCGTGANVPFFLSRGLEYYTVEGSEFAVRTLKKEYREIEDNFVCGDFTRHIPFQGPFDLIVDRSSIKHNGRDDIERTVESVHSLLKPNGRFIGIDWSSTEHTSFTKSEATTGDPYFRTACEQGSLKNIGGVFFFSEEYLLELLSDFEILFLEHKEQKRVIPSDNYNEAGWLFVAGKNG